MAIEIILVRFFEIASLLGFLLMTVYVSLFLFIIKIALIVLGFIAKPLIAILMFYITRMLGIIMWSLAQTIDGFTSYGHKLLME